MKIGIISDTHSYLDEQIFHYFKEVDEIWHAGDIGTNVLNQLQQFKPTQAVYGNIDDATIRTEAPEFIYLERENCRIVLTHIAGSFGKYNTTTRAYLQKYQPTILVCGHSHIVKVAKDKTYNLLYINSGAAGIHGFHKMRTILRFELDNGIPKNLQLIELGSRSKL